ncbi:MAG: hypothetical protein HDT37_03630 [Clostridiales bacterium]|nr:hypothetical protein [Clostridiales bacterium]
MGGRKGQYGYHEYRGRGGGRGRTVLLFIIALLLLLLAAGAVFYAMVDLEYTDTGVKINWRGSQASQPLPPIASDPLEIVTGPVDVAVEPTETVDPTPTPSPEPEYQPIAAVTVTTAQLRGGSAAQAVASAGGNALVVEMKNVNGYLAWQSQAALAATMGTNAADNLAAQAVQTLAQTTDLYLVAKVQCFRDPLLATNRIGSLMTRGGNVWHDLQGMGWSSPANQQAADYLFTLCLELADMGFDEILLDQAGYPNFGEVNVLATSDNRPEDLTIPVSAFLERLSGALAQRGVCLGVLTDETLDPGDAVLTGLTSDVLAGHVGRVWLDGSADAQQYSSLLTAAGWSDAAPRVVAKNAPFGGGSWYR